MLFRSMTEEALAYFLEANPKANLAQRVMEMFRQFVRAIGNTLKGMDKLKFMKWANALTEQELRNMAMRALRGAPDSLQFDNAGRRSGNAIMSYEQSVDAVLNGTSKGALMLGDTPLPLVMSGLPSVPMMVTEQVIDKAHFDHGLSARLLKSLPDLLSKPLMVFKSDTQPGSFVVITHEYQKSDPVMVAIRPNGVIERITPVNVIASAYGKPVGVIGNWIKKGLLVSSDKKAALAFATTNGLQLPAVVQLIRKSLPITIEENNNAVNKDILRSQDNQPLLAPNGSLPT